MKKKKKSEYGYQTSLFYITLKSLKVKVIVSHIDPQFAKDFNSIFLKKCFAQQD